jgi:uncharacterized protein YfkK (UPF0435 family)
MYCLARKDRLNGFQLVCPASESVGSVKVQRWINIGKPCSFKQREDIVDYCKDILAWYRTGKQNQEKIYKAIEEFDSSLPVVNEFLAECGLLNKRRNESLRDIFDLYVNTQNLKSVSMDARVRVWKRIFNDYGEGFPVSKLTSEIVDDIYNAVINGRYSKTKNGKRKKDSTINTELAHIHTVLDLAASAKIIPPFEDISHRFSPKTTVAEKEYIGIEESLSLYKKLSSYPDYQFFMLFLRVLGSRPEEAWQDQTWESIIWDCPKAKTRAVEIDRYYRKDPRFPSGGVVRCPVPAILQEAINVYRAFLLDAAAVARYAGGKKGDRPEDIGPTGRMFRVRAMSTGYGELGHGEHSLANRLMGRRVANFFTSLRASASCNLYDYGGAEWENKILHHNEKSRIKHYSPENVTNSPLSSSSNTALKNRPDRWVKPDGDFLQHLEKLWLTGDGYYSELNPVSKYHQELAARHSSGEYVSILS